MLAGALRLAAIKVSSSDLCKLTLHAYEAGLDTSRLYGSERREHVANVSKRALPEHRHVDCEHSDGMGQVVGLRLDKVHELMPCISTILCGALTTGQ